MPGETKATRPAAKANSRRPSEWPVKQAKSPRRSACPVGEAKASPPRSGCPVSISLETFGDRWSLLIIRDLMVRGFRTFKQFHDSGEGIATNILAERLQKLQTAAIITAECDEGDARRINYRLTEKGIDLAPVLLELLVWGARHEPTAAPCALIDNMAENRERVLAEIRRRWRERDSTPLLPQFSDAEFGGKSEKRGRKG